CARDQSGYDYW
nr:immunoglobulin heavy chain junction region [Macaca mulatta]MOW75537.1 immunoglobulin heavy chain junction region [Macaca mulatta]MOW75691.1 immunoglobulin heavy chain junction region [Macaca mulatta]MOW75836.1 immunoglobulin heavy chain junction region [Macaca mulatta]MOW75865.1 immunoglobulin heavy chain junction region [Macaca mulatta]